jgi:hypothetical protein
MATISGCRLLKVNLPISFHETWEKRGRPEKSGSGDIYGGDCGGLVAPTMAAVTAVIVGKRFGDSDGGGFWSKDSDIPSRRWRRGFGGADFSCCNYGGSSLYFQIKQRFSRSLECFELCLLCLYSKQWTLTGH